MPEDAHRTHTTHDAAPGDAEAGSDPMQHLREAMAGFAEAGEHLKNLATAKASGVVYAVKKLALLAVLGVVAGIAGIAFVAASTVLLLMGLSQALNALTGLTWLGPLVVGLLGLLLSVGGTWLAIKMLASAGRKSAVQTYRRLLLTQHFRYGTDAYSRAAAQAASETPHGPKPAGTAADTEAEAKLRRDLDLLKTGGN